MITHQARKALHLYFNHLAEELNNAGLNIRTTMKGKWDIPWSGATIKEIMWKPIQRKVFKKESTNDLTSKEIDTIFNVISQALGTRFGIILEFPSLETLLEKMEKEKNEKKKM